MHGPRCAYCHRYFLDSELSVDHIVPRALSGKSTIRNMQTIVPFMSQNERPAVYQVDTEECMYSQSKRNC